MSQVWRKLRREVFAELWGRRPHNLGLISALATTGTMRRGRCFPSSSSCANRTTPSMAFAIVAHCPWGRSGAEHACSAQASATSGLEASLSAQLSVESCPLAPPPACFAGRQPR